MKTWLKVLCCSISFFLLTGCAAFKSAPQDKSPPRSKASPPPPPPPTPAKEVSFDPVYFEYDKASLTPESIATLDETVRVLKENPGILIELAGFTDARGTDAYNLKLSERRVQTVHQYLVSWGISENRLKTAAFGKAKPVSDDKTEEGRAQNRRVEMRVIRTP